MEKCFTADLNQGHRSNDDLALQTYLHLINADQNRPVHIGGKKRKRGIKNNDLSYTMLFIKTFALSPTALYYS